MLGLLAGRLAEGGAEPPTQRELGRAMGFSSAQTAAYHLGLLEEGGYIERLPAPSRKRRQVRITERGMRELGPYLMGRIAAGRGMDATPVREATDLFAALFGSGGDGRFLLEARGQSMTGAGIEDGDLLLVVPDPSPPDGTVVAAMIVGASGDGTEVTVKRLFREGSAVRLRAENGAHRDIVVGADEVEVQGKVEYIVRRPWGR
jgi:repressor LexA